MPEAKPGVKYRYTERLVWTGLIMASLVHLNLLLIPLLLFSPHNGGVPALAPKTTKDALSTCINIPVSN